MKPHPARARPAPRRWPSFPRGARPILALAALVVAVPGTECYAQTPDTPPGPPAPEPRPYVEPVPGTPLSFTMVPVPAGSVRVNTADGPRTIRVDPFWIAKTEATWELYDLFVYGRDRAEVREVAAVSHPSKPYVLPGERFGHEGHPALAMTHHAAKMFARWISERTGRAYRLPTEAEWRLACRLGRPAPRSESSLRRRAWHHGNARGETHPVAALEPNGIGVHDLLGNVAEWVAGADGEAAVLGGTFADAPDDVHCASRRTQTDAWNATDPQLPKSRWWLSDAPFVGFRLVRGPDDRSRTPEEDNR